jgi:hypothetical protein
MISRLLGDRRKTTDFLKTCRGQLPAGIAINAGCIDKKVTCDIGVESLFLIGHGTTPYALMPNRMLKESVSSLLASLRGSTNRSVRHAASLVATLPG